MATGKKQSSPMGKRGRRYVTFSALCHKEVPVSLDEALNILAKGPSTRFDETVDIAVKLGIDMKRSDQSVRGVCVLPHTIARPLRIAVFAPEDMHKKLLDAGADIVGEKDLAEIVRKGTINFDRCLAHPAVMSLVGTLGRVLGPRGLMPNPRAGTVSENIVEALEKTKKGVTEIRPEKGGNVYAAIGRKSFGKEKLTTNIHAFVKHLLLLKPSGLKKPYIESVSISTTMSPSVTLKHGELGEIHSPKSIAKAA